jgi:hypothetical protein
MSTFDTTDDANFITEYNVKTLLPIMKMDAPYTNCLTEQPFEPGHGTDVYFRGRNPLAKVSGTLLAGTEMTDPTPVTWAGRKIKAQVYRLHNSINASSTERKVSFDQMRQDRDAVANNIIESMEYHNRTFIDPYLVHVRADWDRTSPFQGEYAATSAGSTTTIVSTYMDDASGHANDYWGGNSTYGYIMPITLTDPNYGQGRIVSDFATSGDLLTVSSAWTTATADTQRFINCIGTSLTTGDKMTMATIAKVNAVFDHLHIKKQFKWPTGKGFGFRGFLSGFDYYDVTQDTNYLAYNVASSKAPGFMQYRVDTLYNNDIFVTDVDYRESVGGVVSETGAVYNSTFLGKGAGYRVALVKPTVKVVMEPDSSNLLGYKTWISWTTDYACAPVVGTAGIVVLSVPTGLL